MTDVLLTWLCSYLLHSSLLIAGLWAAERAGWLGRLSTSTQEGLWRLALLGGLASASLPLLPAPSARARPDEAPRPVIVSVEPVATTARPARVVELPTATVAAAAAEGPAAPVARLGALPVVAPMAPQAHAAAIGFIALWLAGAVLMGAGLCLQWAWLRRAVRRLPALGDPRWLGLATGLAADMGVPLPALRHARRGWASPLLAPGRVLCLPGWCLDLPDDEARAVLGHELAHLRRRDPAWRLLAAVVKALLWPQPLNRVALRRLDLLAELACDAAAAAPAGQRLALAQSLLRCAEALKAGRPGPVLACGAAGQGSPLLARVRRLLRPEAEAPRERRALRWGLLVGMLATLVALPAVVVSHTDPQGLLERLGGFGHRMTWDSATRADGRQPGGSFHVDLRGQATFNDAEDDVQTLDGRLTVRERQGDVEREMTLTSQGDGRIERDYRVGRERIALDEAGRQWWARAAQRVSGVVTAPRLRARRLFARGGMDAVLADLDRAEEDFVRHLRIEAAVSLGQPLDAAAQDRLLAATGQIAGGFERREALRALAGLALAEPQQLGWLKSAEQIDGDFERREALAALAPRLATTPAVLQAWQGVLAGIGGDFELRTAIETQVGATPEPAVLRAALQSAGKLQGDFERRETLGAIAQRLDGGDAELVQAYLQLAGGIQGAFEKREALVALLDRSRLAPAGLQQLIATAEGVDAGFERLQVLLRVADKLAEAPPVPGFAERLRRAGRGLGEFERGQLERALDRLG